ncbi:MAG: MarR family transcriptional regulator [Nitrospirae bacterium]|nr:MarR family transcriptional regulator [Nitrospirota bacterium]
MTQKTRSRRFTEKDVEFVHTSYSAMTAAEIAAARKLSLFQVNKIVADLRKNGIDLPRKTPKRINPVKAYIESLKSGAGVKPAVRKTRKKAAEAAG